MGRSVGSNDAHTDTCDSDTCDSDSGNTDAGYTHAGNANARNADSDARSADDCGSLVIRRGWGAGCRGRLGSGQRR